MHSKAVSKRKSLPKDGASNISATAVADALGLNNVHNKE